MFFWTSALSYSITGINYVLRMVCIMLVTWIGYKDETEQLIEITNVVFVVQFFNTAFLLLISNANMSGQFLLGWIFRFGDIPDFNSEWYRRLGNTIQGTMIFSAYFPILEFFGFWGMRVGFRLLDRGLCSMSIYRTKCTAIQPYINTYAGPLYFMHYKYSTILNVSFVTMMYGFGIPMLFPIAVGAFITLYFVEKMMLYYAYRMPPMYDMRLSESVLRKLEFAPMFFAFFGYWMVSSNQLLSNDFLEPVQYASSVEIVNHGWLSVFTPSGWASPAWPLLVYGIWSIVVLIFGGIIHRWLGERIPFIKIGDVKIDEDIPDYYATLNTNDLKWSIEEENHYRNYGLKMLPEETFIRMQRE